ncbi:MAG TPA: PEP-CTERM sorting domain-containing protein [Rhodanobacter sp.]|nr:PEP-CTERM sorting domain-containing protein [Rhodanobacter sp.]
MLKKKSIGAALACALALGAWSGSTLATPTDVAGVWIDPSSPLDLNVQALNFRESSVAAVGDVLQGYGVIGSINGTNPSTFCPSCDVNFTFTYTVSDITGNQVVFDLGTINFFVDNTSSFNVLDPTTAGVGAPWLTLSGHTAPYAGFAALGQLYATINGPVSDPLAGSAGFGLLDATGGPAMFFTDTNTQADGSDFSLVSSFQFQDAGICSAGLCYPISGTGQLIGASAVVPEPGAAGLLGLGLAFLGLFTWRRRKEGAGQS